MKRNGTIAAIIFVAVIVGYMAVYIIGAFASPLTTSEAVLITAEETVTINGYFVRDEQPVLSAGTGDSEACVSEGEKVSAGEALAVVYSDSNAKETNVALSTAESRLERLQRVASSSTTDISGIDSGISSSLNKLAYSTLHEEFSSLSTTCDELKTLVLERELLSSGDISEVESTIAALEAEVLSLRNSISGVTAYMYAPASGYFSSSVDGYEDVLTPEKAETITVAELQDISLQKADVAEGKYCGKMVYGFEWRFVTAISQDKAELLDEGGRITLRFSSDYIGDVRVNVERISEPENGECVVVFSSNTHISELMHLRRQSVDIVFASYEGIRVPKEAIRIDENGESGVYILYSAQAKFIKIKQIYEADSYFVIEYDASSSSGLRPGDEIIVHSKNLYDGKIIE